MIDHPDRISSIDRNPLGGSPDQIPQNAGILAAINPYSAYLTHYSLPNDGFMYALDSFQFLLWGFQDTGGLCGLCQVAGGYADNQSGSSPVYVCQAWTDAEKYLKPCETIRPTFQYPYSFCQYVYNSSSAILVVMIFVMFYKYKIQ